MNDATRLRIRRELAERMGTHFWFTDSHPEHSGTRWLTTREKMATACRQYPTIHETGEELPIDWKLSDVPDPFTNHADCAALVEWLAADDQRWFIFIRKLIKLIDWPTQSPEAMTDATFDKIASEVRYLMTSPLPVRVLAACAALGIDTSDQ